jgi:hypothetical protein
MVVAVSENAIERFEVAKAGLCLYILEDENPDGRILVWHAEDAFGIDDI